MKTTGTLGTTKIIWEAYIYNARGNGDIPSTLELVWLTLVHIYALVALLIDDHTNIVQITQVLINLSYVGIIEPNS